MKNVKILILVIFCMAIFGVVIFSYGEYNLLINSVFAENNEESNEEAEEEEKEEEIEETEEDIEKVEKKIEKEEKKKVQLEQNLNVIQHSISHTRQEIQKTEEKLSETKETIKAKEKQIELLNEKIEIQRKILAKLLQELYYSEQDPLLFLVVAQANLSLALSSSEHILTVEKRIDKIIEGINHSKEDINNEKSELEEKKESYNDLLGLKEDQEKSLASNRIYTQAKISKKDSSIEELRGKLNKLRSSLTKLLGKAYDTDDIEDAAKFASKVTGVRRDFIMGMLVVESDLGRYTGGCNYKESRMNSHRKDLFKKIAKKLDYDYKKLKVSCPPRNYRGTGGAMGVAQFMSDTWMGYEAEIASLTGHNPPDPWSLTDGVTAMAVKLSKVPGVTKHKKSAECKAAKLYLGGSHQWYCDKVLYWADNYEDKLN